MAALTKKQMENRAYYEKNKARITARKRAQFTTSKPAKPARARKTKPEPVTIKPEWEATKAQKTKASSPKPKISAEDAARLKARRAIEDILMAKELGIDSYDL